MSETLDTVVQQLEVEHHRLTKILEQKQAETIGIKAEVDRVQVALAALKSPPRPAPSTKPGPSRSDLLAIVTELLTAHGGQLNARNLKDGVLRSLKKSGLSARGLHKSLPHVLADNSLLVEGEIVTLRR